MKTDCSPLPRQRESSPAPPLRRITLCLLTLGLLSAFASSDLLSQPRRPPRRGRPPLPPVLPPQAGPMPMTPLPGGPVPILPGMPSPFLPDPAAATPVVAPTYQGDFHLEVSEELLQTLVKRQEVSSGAVQDYVSGAVVNGQQTTQSDVSIDCLPSAQGAQFDFIVQGVVSSSTNAATPQATIQQQGNTAFRASKRVLLNGDTILTQKAVVQVMPNLMVTGAQTRPGPLSMFGNLGNRMAYRAAMARLPESNLIAGQKTISRLQPEMDQKIDSQLAEADKLVRDNLWKRLETWNVLPEYKAAFSTAERLHWDYRLRTDPVPFVAVNTPPQQNAVGSAVTVHCHDSLFSTVAARRQLGGKSVSLNELREATDRFLGMLAEEIPNESPDLPVSVIFTFDTRDPLRGSYANNELLLTLKGSFQAGNLPATPTQRIQLTIDAQMEADSFVIEVTDVDVHQLGADNSVEEPGLTQTAIAQQLEQQLRPIRLKRAIPLPTPNGGPSLTLSDMTAQDGWLKAEFALQTWRPTQTETPSPVHSAPTPAPTFVPAEPPQSGPALRPTFPQ